MQRVPAMRKSGKRKPGRYDLRICIQLALAACISFCTKITVRFKLNLKTDGPDCKMIFKFGKHVERFHSTRKQCRRIYICLFCVEKYLLGTPKPLNYIRWMQATRFLQNAFLGLRRSVQPSRNRDDRKNLAVVRTTAPLAEIMKKAPKNFYAIGKFIIAMLLQHYSADAILK